MHKSVPGLFLAAMSWNASHAGGCVDRHVVVVTVVLQSSFSTALVVLSLPARRALCWVGWVVRNFLLLSNSAGDFNWWSTGVVLYDSIPRYGSSPSSSHLRRVFFTACTMRSANPFDWGYSGELLCSIYIISFCKLAKLSTIVLWHIVHYELGGDSMFGKNAFHMIYYGKGTGAS